jgi:small subunit ribosomal protein S14
MASIRWKVKAKKTPKFKTRTYNRCGMCGRRRGYYRRFQICRHCLRLLVSRGEIPGVRKASW